MGINYFEKTERKIRSDKRTRVNPSLSQDDNEKLESLALACANMPKTKLAGELINYCLNNPEIVNLFQQEKFPYKHSYLKVIPVLKDGKCIYKNIFDK
jgi:hypothetical protein